MTDFNRLTDCHSVKYTKHAVVVCPYLIYEMSVLLNIVIITVQITIAHVISLFYTRIICDYASVPVPLMSGSGTQHSKHMCKGRHAHNTGHNKL